MHPDVCGDILGRKGMIATLLKIASSKSPDGDDEGRQAVRISRPPPPAALADLARDFRAERVGTGPIDQPLLDAWAKFLEAMAREKR